jgi:rhamnulokinase
VNTWRVAVDVGASGGRLMLGGCDGDTLTLSEIHRFPNEPVTLQGVLYWDFPRLFAEILTGLRKIAASGITIQSVGIDTWGVDYGLLDKNGRLLSLPIHYRDARTEAHTSVPGMSRREVYARTGIQHMPFNTLFQLQADYALRPDVLEAAHDLLFMPDLFAYFLTGEKINEYTIAGTSQLLNVKTADWDDALLPPGTRRLFKPLTMPGTGIGPLKNEIQIDTGLGAEVSVIAVGSHDTASAVGGTPLTGGGAYLSCGTWSLMGVELDAPCLSEASYKHNFTNENGIGGKVRYLKNINGLYIMQELLKAHNRTAAHKMDFAALSRAAENETRTGFAVNPNDPAFNAPEDMAKAVADYFLMHGRRSPQTVGEAARAVYDGLAREYGNTLRDMESVLGKPIRTVHMVGGGVQDRFLCAMTAETIGRPVIAGPVEASALGNIVAQMMGAGELRDVNEGRDIIRRSFTPVAYG